MINNQYSFNKYMVLNKTYFNTTTLNLFTEKGFFFAAAV